MRTFDIDHNNATYIDMSSAINASIFPGIQLTVVH